MLFNNSSKILICSFIFIVSSCNYDGLDSNNKVKSDRLNPDLVKNNQSLIKENNKIGQAIIEVDNLEFDFGEITEGESASHNYKIKNVGTGDLIISSAKGSCGCTVPEWPKDPIKPGEEGNVRVTFNSKSKKGNQSKRVTLLTNTIPNVTILTIKGNVIIKN
jgi:hypothetical protein|tara:strand:+ start:4530 stop:5015 length:486 start_codon:yes stop_codon:yes gene_type:complete